jgi:gas vesicle protein
MNTGKVLLGLIAGFAAGASLGIILAPAKGSETRKIFRRKRADASDPLIETFIEFLNSVSGNDENVNKLADELINRVKSTTHDLAKDKKERSTVVTESGTYKI